MSRLTCAHRFAKAVSDEVNRIWDRLGKSRDLDWKPPKSFCIDPLESRIMLVAPTIGTIPAVSTDEGKTATVVVPFYDSDGTCATGGYSAMIQWGDGTCSDMCACGCSGCAISINWYFINCGCCSGPVCGTLTATHVYADNRANNAAYTATLHLSDASSTAPPASFSAYIYDVRPTLTVGGAATVGEGSPYTLSLGHTDPGTADPLGNWSINWGDGSALGSPVLSTTTTQHTFASGAGHPSIVVTNNYTDGEAGGPFTATTVNIDTTFGSSGKYTGFLGRVQALTIGSDGKIYAAFGNGGTGIDKDFIVARFSSNGVLDNTFGDFVSGSSGPRRGYKIVDFGSNSSDYVSSMAIVNVNGTDRLLVAGSRSSTSTSNDFAILRFNASDGSLDTGIAGDATLSDSFGTLGKQFVDFNGGYDYAYGMAIQGDKIVLVGSATMSTGFDFGVARLNSNGTLDTDSFGDVVNGVHTGKTTVDFLSAANSAYDVKIAPVTNDIVVAGTTSTSAGSGTGNDLAVARFTTDGALDTSFGRFVTGSTTVRVGWNTVDVRNTDDSGRSVLIQNDGKIVVGGSSTSPSIGDLTDFALARFNDNGTLDDGSANDSNPSDRFGSGGSPPTAGTVMTNFDFGSDEIFRSVMQSNGRLVVVGSATTSGGLDFAIARYLLDGSLDQSFGQGGKFTTDFSIGSITNDVAYAVALQADGKILAGGISGTSSAMVRYQPFSTLDVTVVPHAPSNLAISRVGGSDVQLNWTDNSAVETGFVIQRSGDGGTTWTDIDTVASNVITYRGDGVTNFTGSCFRVMAFNGIYRSTASNTLTTSVLGASAPSGMLTNNGPVKEGETARVLFSSATDPSGGALRYSFSTSMGALATSYATATPTNSFSTVFGDDGTYSVYGRLFKSDGQYTDYSTTVTVLNAAPLLHIDGNSSVIAGQTYALSLSATDPGSDQISHWTINWGDNSDPDGDGTVGQIVAGNPSSASHLFAATRGLRTITATATDEDGTYDANPMTITIGGLGTPTSFTPVVVSNTQINATWADNATLETAYEVSWATDASFATTPRTVVLPANTTSYQIQGLNPGGIYYLRVRAIDSWTNSASAYATAGPITMSSSIPATPGNLIAVAMSQTEVQLDWTDLATGESAYKVEAFTDATLTTPAWGSPVMLSNDASTYRASGLQPATQYWFRVTALGGTTLASQPATASATTFARIATPINLVASSGLMTAINLSWTDVALNEAGYKVEYSTHSDFPAGDILPNYLLVLAANTSSHTFTDLVPGTTYYFRVKAISSTLGIADSSKDSEYSNIAQCTTASTMAGPVHLAGIPVAWPVGVQLGWEDSSSDEDGYYVERAVGNGDFERIGSAGGSSFVTPDSQPDTTYRFRVIPYKILGNPYAEGQPSNIISVTTGSLPPAPQWITPTVVGPNRINLQWSDPSSSEDGFEIQMSEDTDFTSPIEVATEGANVTFEGSTYFSALSNLQANHPYWFRVRTLQDHVPSAWTVSDPATTQTSNAPAVPTSLKAAAVSPFEIRLAWDDNSSNEDGFEIQRSVDGVTFVTIDDQVPQNNEDWDSSRAYSFPTLPNTTYQFKIAAYRNVDGVPVPSLYSTTTAITTPALPVAPSNVTAVAVATNLINVSWQDQSSDEGGYRVEWSTDSNFTSFSSMQAGANDTFAQIQGRTPSTQYWIRVGPEVGSELTNWAAAASTVTTPATDPSPSSGIPANPGNVSAVVVSDSQINVRWSDNSNNEDRFLVQCATDSGFTTDVRRIDADPNTTYSSFKGLSANTTYYVRVSAFNWDYGQSSPITLPGNSTVTTAQSSVPAAPSMLTGVFTSSGIILGWRDNSSNETGFRIEELEGGLWNSLGTEGANSTTSWAIEADLSTTYQFRVVAYNDTGDSASSTFSIATPNPPVAPDQVNATMVSPTQMNVTWRDNSTNEDRFEVEIATLSDHSDAQNVSGPDANISFYQWNNAVPNQTYYVRVHSWNYEVGPSSWSDWVTVAPFIGTNTPAAPSQLQAVATSAKTIRLSWLDNSSNENGFLIERSVDGGGFEPVQSGDANLTAADLADHLYYVENSFLTEPGHDYTFRIAAIGHDAANQPLLSLYSNPVVVNTPPLSPPPTNIVVVPYSPTQINISWHDASAFENALGGYDLECSEDADFQSDNIFFSVDANVESAQLTGLFPNDQYYIRIRSVNATMGDSDWVTLPGTYTTASIPAPTNLVALSGGPRSVTLTWQESSQGERGFIVERATGNGPFVEVDSTDDNIVSVWRSGTWSYSVELPDHDEASISIDPDTQYQYRVREYWAPLGLFEDTDGDGEDDAAGGGDEDNIEFSNYSNIASVHTRALITPAAPTGISVTSVSNTRARINWQDNSNNEDGFTLEWSAISNFATLLGSETVAPNATSFNLRDLSPATTYYVRVRSYDEAPSAYATGSFTTTNVVPAAPQDFHVFNTSDSSASLTWTETDSIQDGFQISFSANGGAFSSPITISDASTGSFSIGDLLPSTPYTFRIVAYNGAGQSAAITTTATTDSAHLSAVPVSQTRIALSWQAVSERINGYSIEISQNGGAYSPVTSVGSTTTHYLVPSLAAGTTYSFRVTPTQSGGNLPSLNIVTATTPTQAQASIPSGLTASIASSTSVVLSWTFDSSAAGGVVKIERSSDGVSFSPIGQSSSSSFTDNTVVAGTAQYQYRVRSSTDSVDSNPSAPVTIVFTAPAAPIISATPASSSEIDVTWNSDANAQSYSIETMLSGGTNWSSPIPVNSPVPSFALQFLSPGTTYLVRVGASNALGQTWSSPATVQTPVLSPDTFSGSPTSQTGIVLNWAQSTGATSYTLERSDDSGVRWHTLASGVTALTYSDSQLTAGSGYLYRLTAVNAQGAAETSSVATVYTLPSAPSGLVATLKSGGEVDLAWQNNSQEGNGFRIEYSTNDTTWNFVSWPFPGSSSAAVYLTFAAGQTYYFRVVPLSGGSALGPPSNEAHLTVPVLPAAPTGLSATTGPSQITLHWVDAAGDFTGFVVEKWDSLNTVWSDLATVPADTTTYTDYAVDETSSNSYRVRAVGASGSQVSVSTSSVPPSPNPPGNLTALFVSASRVELSWDDQSVRETSFSIEESTSSTGGWLQIGTAAANATSYVATGPFLASQTYYFHVLGLSSGVNSGWSNSASITVPALPAAPTNFVAVGGSGEVDLSWTDNSGGQAGFTIERRVGASGDWFPLANIAAGTTAYADTSAVDNLSYSYRIAAQGSQGASDYSPVTTGGGGGGGGSDTINLPLPAPTNLGTGAVSSLTGISLLWTTNAASATGTKVEWQRPGDSTFSDAPGSPVVGVGKSNLTIPGPLKPGTYHFRISTLRDSSTSATATRDVIVPNVAPIAQDDSTLSGFGTVTPLTVLHGKDLPNITVLSNDSDPDQGPQNLTIASYTNPSHGTVTLSADGKSFTYHSDSSFTGVDTFTYKATDSADQSNSATVTIQVTNHNPHALSQGQQGGQVLLWGGGIGVFDSRSGLPHVPDLVASGILGGSDADSDPITYKIESESGGSVSITPDGHFTVRGGKAPWPSGTLPNVTFTYRTSDGLSVSNLASVTVKGGDHYLDDDPGDGDVDWEHFTPAPDRPTANYATITVQPKVPYESVLTGAVSQNGGVLTFGSVIEKPRHGSLSISGLNYTYKPDADYYGEDWFTFTLKDDHGNSDYATIWTNAVEPNQGQILEIDSDNNNGFAAPDFLPPEISVKHRLDLPGKVIATNKLDDDHDQIPGYADGYNLDGKTDAPGVSTDDTASSPFPEVVLTLPSNFDRDHGSVTISYSASDPSKVSVTGSGTTDDPYVYHLPQNGALRLWTQPGSRTVRNVKQRNLDDYTDNYRGFYVAPGTYSGDDLKRLGLPYYGTTLTLYVERVRSSVGDDERKISATVDVYGDGKSASDFVVTSQPEGLRVDSTNTSASDPEIGNDGKFSQTIKDYTDSIKTDPTKLGKIIVIDDQIPSDDSIPAFANGVSGNPWNPSDASKFVPLVIELPRNVNASNVKLSFSYDGSDPTGVRGPDQDDPNAGYTLPGGSLRLWGKDGSQQRSDRSIALTSGQAGDYITPNTPFSASSLQWRVSGQVQIATVYIEALTPSAALSDKVIQYSADLEGNGSFSTFDTARFTFVQASVPDYTAGGSVLSVTAGADGQNPGALGYSGAVRLSDGTLHLSMPFISADADSLPWGFNLTNTNQIALALNPSFGNGMIADQFPHLIQATNAMIAVVGGQALYFDQVAPDTYRERYFGQEKLTYNKDNHEYKLVESTGAKILFNDFQFQDESDPVKGEYKRGAFKQYTSANGTSVTVSAYSALGNITSVTYGNGNSLIYAYTSTQTSDQPKQKVEHISSVTLSQKGKTVQSAAFEFYKKGDTNGDEGDLKLVTVSWGATVVSHTYYRYASHNLTLILSGARYARAVHDHSDYQTASNSVLSPYADYQFTYGTGNKVASQSIQGAGANASDKSAVGRYQYIYDSASSSGGIGTGVWNYKTTVTLPDNNTRTDYLNRAGELLLEDFKDVSDQNSALAGLHWNTFYTYDAQGRLLWTAQPSTRAQISANEPDLLDQQDDGTYRYLSANEGVITGADYYGTSDANPGYLKDTYIQHGQSGDKILQSSFQYKAIADRHLVSDITTYRNETSDTSDTSGILTHYDYQLSGNRITSITTTLPEVTVDQNGQGDIGTSVVQNFDSLGRLNDVTDADGYKTTYGYDDATGAVKSAIQQVGNGNPDITTSAIIDDYGRATGSTDGNGKTTHTTFLDGENSTKVTVSPPAGPSMVNYTNSAMGYSDTYTSDGSATHYSLFRTDFDFAGRTLTTERYFDISMGYAEGAASPRGKKDKNYYQQTVAYDAMGRLKTDTDAVGTTHETRYDSLGRVYQTLTAGVTVQTNQYDNNAVGDGMLTRSTVTPGSNQSDRVTTFYNDWRGRTVATNNGIQIAYADYDNLDETIVSSIYDAKSVIITGQSNGVPNRPAASGLRAKSQTDFDDRGRVYRTTQFSVDPISGAIGSDSLTTNVFHDNRGNIIETDAPGGIVTRAQFDGAGRQTLFSTGASIGDPLEETDTQYDKNGNAILVTTNQQLPDSSYRIGYVGNWYDDANRPIETVNFGTNGGAPITTRPATVTRSTYDGFDPYLVTEQHYDNAGHVDLTTDPRGIQTKTSYDALGRHTSVINAYQDGAIDATTDQEMQYTYDGLDHILTQTQFVYITPQSGAPYAGARTTRFVYGATIGGGAADNDLLLAVNYPNTVTGKPSVANGYREAYSYDNLGEVMTKYERTGISHQFTYDATGRLLKDAVSGFRKAADDLFDTSVDAHAFVYDVLGRATLLTSLKGGNVVNQVKRTYDGVGNMISEESSATGPVNGTGVQYRYDTSNNRDRLTTTIYPDGRELLYKYDGSTLDNTISRVTSIVDNTGSAAGQTLETYTYLGLSTVIQKSRPEAGMTMSYLSQPNDALAPATPSGTPRNDGGDSLTGLDRFGRVLDQNWFTTATGAALDRRQYAYDADSNLLYAEDHRAPYSQGLSPASNLNQADGASASAAYDTLNRQVNYQRGALGFVTGATRLDLISNESVNQIWALDPDGNYRLHTTDAQGHWVSTASQRPVLQSQLKDSDVASRAENESTQPPTALSVQYDAWGFMTDQINWNVTYTFVSTDDSGDGYYSAAATISTKHHFSYDALGRRISEGTAVLYYDQSGHVIQETVPGVGGFNAQYVYGADGNLLLRDWDSDSTLSTGNLGHSGSGLDQRLYAIEDAQGNVSAIADVTGAVLERYLYTPNGSLEVHANDQAGTLRSGPSYQWRYLFQGTRQDGPGLYYLGAGRGEHDALTGGTLSLDPVAVANHLDSYSEWTERNSEVIMSEGWQTTQTVLRWVGTAALTIGTLGGSLAVGFGLSTSEALIASTSLTLGGAGAGAIFGSQTDMGAEAGSEIGMGVAGLLGGVAANLAKGAATTIGCRIASATIGAANGAAIGGGIGFVSGFSEGWGRYGSVDAGISMGLHSAKMGAIFGGISGAALGASGPSVCFVAGTQVVVGLKIQEDEGGIVAVTAKELARQDENDGRRVATMLRIVGYVTANIEDVKEGDYVVSRNQCDSDGPLVAGKVTRMYRRTANHLQVVGIEDGEQRRQTIFTTGEHPFHVADRGWTASRLLSSGDKLSGLDNALSTVIFNGKESRPSGVTVYNMEIQGSHSYFVQAEKSKGEPVWVHNSCEGLLRDDEMLADNLGGRKEGYTPHHLLGVAEVQRYPVMAVAAEELGYNVNRGNNGINLPNTLELAEDVNLPYHPQHGRHSPSTYTGPVNELLGKLQTAYDSGAVPKPELMNEISNIENSVRSRLLSGELRLNSRYPDYPWKK